MDRTPARDPVRTTAGALSWLGDVVVRFAIAVGVWGVAAAEPTPLPTVPGKKSHLAWSARGEAVAFLATTADGPRLVLCAWPAGPPRDLGPASAFAWSPAGEQLVIARPAAKTAALSLCCWPEAKETPLTTGDTPVFARDGASLGFVRDGEVFCLGLDGTREHRLSTAGRLETRLGSGPDRFLFTGNGCLWAAAPAAAEQMLLRNAGMGTASGGLEYYVDLAVSPDGARIVLVSSGGQDASGAPTSLVLVNADGSGKQTLGPGREPCWSPDGKAVAFSAGGDLWLYLVGPGTSRRLTDRRQANHAWPAWAPAGNRLAFAAILSDSTGDGKVDWRDQPEVFTMVVDAGAAAPGAEAPPAR